ncbi:hypothetical protein [Alteribacter populi]|nr:hypothetical protein [Alteribacter populi]
MIEKLLKRHLLTRKILESQFPHTIGYLFAEWTCQAESDIADNMS